MILIRRLNRGNFCFQATVFKFDDLFGNKCKILAQNLPH